MEIPLPLPLRALRMSVRLESSLKLTQNSTVNPPVCNEASLRSSRGGEDVFCFQT